MGMRPAKDSRSETIKLLFNRIYKPRRGIRRVLSFWIESLAASIPKVEYGRMSSSSPDSIQLLWAARWKAKNRSSKR
jgi:hypothetical protein